MLIDHSTSQFGVVHEQAASSYRELDHIQPLRANSLPGAIGYHILRAPAAAWIFAGDIRHYR
jgi:hypothetical protein